MLSSSEQSDQFSPVTSTLVSSTASKSSVDYSMRKAEYPTKVLGHRSGFFIPENSMKGFQKALEHNLEGVEFDVRRFEIRKVV